MNNINIVVSYEIDDSAWDKATKKIGLNTAESKKLETEMNQVASAARKQVTEFNRAGDAGAKAAKDAGQQYNMLGNTIGSLGGIIAGVFAVDKLMSFGKAVLDTTAEFQKMKAVLTTALGSGSEAERAMLMIQDFAAKTPFSVAELTEAYVKLANRGLKLTNQELTALGDLASSTGKSFDQLTEAALDAMTGENERLKEFGIQAKKTGETTQFTFKGVTTEVKNTDAAVKEYLISLGNVEGVSGSMAAISDTLTGKISNLGDSFDELFLTIGNQQTGVFSETISLINGLTKSITFLIATTDQLGKKQSSEGVTKYAEEITPQFKAVADEARKAGKDVKEALDFKSFSLENDLKDQLLAAEKKLKEFRARRSAPLTQLSELTDVTGFEKTKNKSIEAAFAATVERIKGQLAVINDIKAEMVKPPKDAEGKDEIGRIEKLRLEIKKLTEERDKDANLTQKQANAKNREIAALQKELDLLTKITNEKQKQNDPVKYAPQIDFIEKVADAEEEGFKKRDKAYQDYMDKQMQRKNEEIDKEKAASEEKKRIAAEEAAYKEMLLQETANFAMFAADAYAQFAYYKSQERIEYLQEESAYEISQAGDNAEAKKKIEEQYNKRIAAEKAKQAKTDQLAALFRIAIQTAENITKVFPDPILMGLAGANGIIQAALVKAQPIPKFAKGTRSVMGGTPGEDSVLAMLMPGERVITTDKNQKLTPAFDVLTDSKRSPQFWNKTLLEIEKLGVLSPRVSDLPPVINSNADILAALSNLERAIRTLPIEQHIQDDRGYRRFTKQENSKIEKLNKRYGF